MKDIKNQKWKTRRTPKKSYKEPTMVESDKSKAHFNIYQQHKKPLQNKIDIKPRENNLKYQHKTYTKEQMILILRSWMRKRTYDIINPELRKKYEHYKDVKRKYNVGYASLKRMKKLGMSTDDIYAYYRREYDIYSGKYEKERQKMYIDNYVKYLKSSGISRYYINQFKKWVTTDNIDEILDLDLLPYIQLWGDTKGSDKTSIVDESNYNALRDDLKVALKYIRKMNEK